MPLWTYMPLKVVQIMQSETFALSTGDEFKAAFALWCASWQEVPAASLPNDDRMLDFLSRAKAWKKVKAVAMRGWILCSDGRLYHTVLAACAIDAWNKRTSFREKEEGKTERQRRWREQLKQHAAQLRALGIVPPKGASLETLRSLLEAQGVDAKTSTLVDARVDSVDAVEMPIEVEVEVEGKEKGKLIPTPQRDGASDSNQDQVAKTPLAGAPRAATEESETRTHEIADQLTAAGVVGAIPLNLHITAWACNPAATNQLLAAAASTARSRKGKAPIPINFIMRIVNELLEQQMAAPTATTSAACARRRPQGMEGKHIDESVDEFEARIKKAEAKLRNGATP
jgi:hypothetical protein